MNFSERVMEMLRAAFPPEAPADLDDPKYVKVEGLVNNFLFVREALEAQREAYLALAREHLHENFLKEKGGWSFLNLPADKHGQLQCEQITAQSFLVLGIGLGVAEYCAPRDIWPFLPGGVPYVVFDLP